VLAKKRGDFKSFTTHQIDLFRNLNKQCWSTNKSISFDTHRWLLLMSQRYKRCTCQSRTLAAMGSTLIH